MRRRFQDRSTPWNLTLVVSIFATAFASHRAEADPPAANDPDVVARRVFKVNPLGDLPPDQRSHPLIPALRVAYETVDRIGATVRDYTCRLVMRERIAGRLNPHEYAQLKVRREQRGAAGIATPMSIYIRFESPRRLQGREVLYVSGWNNNELLARNGGTGNLQDVTVSLKPKSDRAVRGRHYPLTEIGMQNIVTRLIETGQESMLIDRQRRECQVRFFEDAKIEGRACRCIQVTFPVERENLKFHQARIFIDDQFALPVRYAAYGWPSESGRAPPLIEEYTFLNLKLNVGLDDKDFDRNNPSYRFYRSRSGRERQTVVPNP